MGINDFNRNQKPENSPETNLYEKDIFSDLKLNTTSNTNRILDFAEVEKVFKIKNLEEYKKLQEILKQYKEIIKKEENPGFYISDIDKLMIIINYKIEKNEDINEIYRILTLFGGAFPREWTRKDFEEKSNTDTIKQRYFYNPIKSFRDPRVKNSAYYDYLNITSTSGGLVKIENKKTGEITEIRSYSGYSNKMIHEDNVKNYSSHEDKFSVTIFEVLMNIFEKQENLKAFYKIQNILFSGGFMHILWEKGVFETYDLTNMNLVNRKFFDRSYSALELISVDSKNIAIKSSDKIIIYKNSFHNKEFEKKEAEYELIYEVEKTMHFSKNIEFETKNRFLEIGENIIGLIKLLQEKEIDLTPISYIFIGLVKDYKYRFEIIENGDKKGTLDKMLEKLEKDIDENRAKFEKI